MKNLNLIGLAVLLLSSSAFSQQAKSLLTRDLQKKVFSLENEIRIYNYFSLQEKWPQLSTTHGRHSYAESYLSYRAGSFFDPEFKDDSKKNYASGPGLYFAIDPLISEPYGNSYIEFIIPAQTKYINVVSPIPIQKDTLLALTKEQYLNLADIEKVFVSKSGFYRDTLRTIVLPEYTKLRALVQEIFTTENIQFIEYNFNSNLNGFCKKASYSAFNFIGRKKPDSTKQSVIDENLKNFKMFSTNFNFENLDADENAAFVRIEKFKKTLRDIIVLQSNKKPITEAFLLSHFTSKEDLEDTKRKSFSCK